MSNNLAYRRVLLKISGEALKGQQPFGIEPAACRRVAEWIADARKLGVEIACVIGGGNIFRGQAVPDIQRATADYMGMLATVMNALALQAALERVGVDTRVLTAIEMRQIAESFIRRRAVRHLEKGRVVIFAAGTGNPYFTTDTAAALRANEIAAHAILKATKVDGIYTADPKKNPQAQRYSRLSYSEALAKRLAVMDAAAFSLCLDNNIPIVVFDFNEPGGLRKVLEGDLSAATIVTQ